MKVALLYLLFAGASVSLAQNCTTACDGCVAENCPVGAKMDACGCCEMCLNGLNGTCVGNDECGKDLMCIFRIDDAGNPGVVGNCVPSCESPKVYTACPTLCPRTCQNKDMDFACAAVCGKKDFCVCPDDYVLLSLEEKTCVREDDCPALNITRDPCVNFDCGPYGYCTAPADYPYCVCQTGYVYTNFTCRMATAPESCSKDCSSLDLSRTSCEYSRNWVCEFLNWRCVTFQWKMSAELWWLESGCSDLDIERRWAELDVCDQQSPVQCTNSSRMDCTPDRFGCPVCHCTDGKYRGDPLMEIYKTHKEKFKRGLELYKEAREVCGGDTPTTCE